MGKRISGLQWYKQVCSFLKEKECFVTTPNMCEQSFEKLKSYINEHGCMAMRVNTEFKKYGFYVSRGKHGNSYIIKKSDMVQYCAYSKCDINDFINGQQIVSYTAKEFMDVRHVKNVRMKERQAFCTELRIARQRERLNNPSLTKEEKVAIGLDVWSHMKLKNNEVATSESENLLYKRLYGHFRKRLRKQQKFIINGRVYFADMYIKSCRAVIEVDGGYHNKPSQIEKDRQKDFDLSTLGLVVIRVSNEDIHKKFKMLLRILDKRRNDIVCNVKVSVGTIKI